MLPHNQFVTITSGPYGLPKKYKMRIAYIFWAYAPTIQNAHVSLRLKFGETIQNARFYPGPFSGLLMSFWLTCVKRKVVFMSFWAGRFWRHNSHQNLCAFFWDVAHQNWVAFNCRGHGANGCGWRLGLLKQD
jgi:hypothetical protein